MTIRENLRGTSPLATGGTLKLRGERRERHSSGSGDSEGKQTIMRVLRQKREAGGAFH